MLLALEVAGLLGVVMLATFRGIRVALFSAFLGASSIAPVRLMHAPSISHAGIAGSTPQIFTYTVVIALGVLVCVGTRKSALPLPMVIVLCYLVIAGLLAWPLSGVTQAGLLVYITAMGAWLCGSFLGAGFGASVSSQRSIAGIVFAVTIIQFAACVLQLLGHPISVPGYDLTTRGYGSRVTGTTADPGNLAKILFLFLVFVLPITRSSDHRARRLAVATVALCVLTTGLTQSRANTIAVLGALILWVILVPGFGTLGSRVRIVFLALAAVAPFAGTIIARFQQDPSGGQRPELLAAGLRQIASNPFIGVGPNNYVDIVGLQDPATAAGFPVHDVFLLAAAEIGIPAAILFFLPFGLTCVQAIRARRFGDGRELYGSALLAILPGLLVIGLTGWGLLSGSTLALWAFTTAFLGGQLNQGRRPPELRDVATTDGQRERQASATASSARIPRKRVESYV